MSGTMNPDVSCPSQKIDDYDAGCNSTAYMGGNNSDIIKRINAMLDNTLDLSNIAAINNEQAKHSQMMMAAPHSQQGIGSTTSYHDNAYSNSAQSATTYPGFHLFYPNSAQPPHSQYKQDAYPSMHYKSDTAYQTQYKPETAYQQLYKQIDSNNNSQFKLDSSICSTPLKNMETPQKPSRAIRGTEKMGLPPQSPGYSDYSNLGTPTTANSSLNETLSPIEQILYSGLMSSGGRQARSPSPYDSDTSGFSSEGSEAALIDMMANMKLGSRCPKSPVSDLSKQLYTSAQQQQQQQQQQQLMPYSSQALQGLQGNAVGLTGEQTLALHNGRAPQVMRPFVIPIANLDLYAIDRAARLHRSAAAMHEASCTWSGKIPPKNYKNPTTFSCKVFLGGVPWDITEAGLQASFNKFGSFKIEWPGRDGYVYLLFEAEKAVKALLQECTHDYSNGEYYFNISSRRMRSKEVQVIPWMLSDSNFVRQPSQRLDANKTVFVGALHGMISAETLAMIMNDLFANVVYAGIDSDKHKYPIGSGRVTFSSKRSYMKAVQAAFVEIKTPKFTKKIQIDPYLEDSLCSQCGFLPGPYFCRDLQCFKYFCRTCWYCSHEPDSMRSHKPLSRNTKTTANLGLM